MGDKAEKNDFKNHVTTDWRSVHGIWDAIRGLIPSLGKKDLVYDQTSGVITNPLIIKGTFTGTGATITFVRPFATGTTPEVVATSNDSDCYCIAFTISATAATVRSYQSTDQTLKSSTVKWIAIGENS